MTRHCGICLVPIFLITSSFFNWIFCKEEQLLTYLFIQLFIYINVDSWIFILCSKFLSNYHYYHCYVCYSNYSRIGHWEFFQISYYAFSTNSHPFCLFFSVRGLNSGLQVCLVGSLLLEPHPSPWETIILWHCGLNSGFCPWQAGTLPCELHLQSILFWWFWRLGFMNYLPWLSLNYDPLGLSLPNC
jgi:hypothetical protein